MSHIVKFEVEDLAGHKGIYKQKLNRDVNIFFGLNGSGKTSLLKILDAAMETDASSLAIVPFKRATVTIYSKDHKRNYTYTLNKEEYEKVYNELSVRHVRQRELHRKERDVIDKLHLSWEVEPPTISDIAHWKHRYLPTTRLFQMGYRRRPDVSASIVDENTLDMHFELALKNYWADFFGDIQAVVRDLQQKALGDVLNEVLTTRKTSPKKEKSLDWETAYDEMVTFLKRHNPKAKPSSKRSFSRRYKESDLLRKVIERIDRVEHEIEAIMFPRTKLQNLIKRMFSGGKAVKFGETSVEVMSEEKVPIGLRSLSSGEKHIIYILVECLRADFSSIIIDEPEISMHVDWQKELILAMRELNPKAQIIAATHSPEILADIDDSKIFRL